MLTCGRKERITRLTAVCVSRVCVARVCRAYVSRVCAQAQVIGACQGKTDWLKKFYNRWEAGRRSCSGVTTFKSGSKCDEGAMCDSAKDLVASGLHLKISTNAPLLTPLSLPAAAAVPVPPDVAAPSAVHEEASSAAERRRKPPAEKALELRAISKRISAAAAALPTGATPMPLCTGKRKAPVPLEPATRPAGKRLATKAATKACAKAPAAKARAKRKPPAADKGQSESESSESEEENEGAPHLRNASPPCPLLLCFF